MNYDNERSDPAELFGRAHQHNYASGITPFSENHITH